MEINKYLRHIEYAKTLLFKLWQFIYMWFIQPFNAGIISL